jgi:hypothetical protein
MDVIVFDKERNYVATITQKSGALECSDVADVNFKKKLDVLIESGIPYTQHSYDSADQTHLYTRSIVRSSDPSFFQALREYLLERDYSVTEYHPDVAKELIDALRAHGEDEVQRELIEQVPFMTYLQQTSLLHELKKEAIP